MLMIECGEFKMKLQKQRFYVLTFLLFVIYLYESLGHSANDEYKKLLKKFWKST